MPVLLINSKKDGAWVRFAQKGQFEYEESFREGKRIKKQPGPGVYRWITSRLPRTRISGNGRETMAVFWCMERRMLLLRKGEYGITPGTLVKTTRLALLSYEETGKFGGGKGSGRGSAEIKPLENKILGTHDEINRIIANRGEKNKPPLRNDLLYVAEFQGESRHGNMF